MTSCPNCDAPAKPGARVCATCGYRFLEDRRPGRATGSVTLARRPATSFSAVARAPSEEPQGLVYEPELLSVDEEAP